LLTTIIDHLLADTTRISLPLFYPELVLCATIVLMLLVKIFPAGEKLHSFWLALSGSLLALGLCLWRPGLSQLATLERQELFTGMLVFDGLGVFLRTLLFAFLVLFLILTKLTHLADREDGQDFFSLVLGATLGMCLMVSANHLMTVFLAIEMASVPSYVLAGLVKGRRRASEAALKYAVYGAGAAGVMLYGISLLAGLLGTAHLPTIGARLSAGPGFESGALVALALAAVMVLVGLAFKLSAVPFHFWAPDVFEGATAEVGAFLSVASKAAALGLLIRLVASAVPNAAPTDTVAALGTRGVPAQFVATSSESAPEPTAELTPTFAPHKFLSIALAVIAAITCTFGNIAAYMQTNIKRMLAYSTIAHAGYLIMPAAAAAQVGGAGMREPFAAILIYAAIYLFMNLTAFAIVAFLRNSLGSEEIADYAGLWRRSPWIVVAMVVTLFSLVGIPPLAGFNAKFVALYALVAAGGPWMMGLVVVACLNTVVSLVYYLRVAKVMCMDAPPEDADESPAVNWSAMLYLLATSAPLLLLFLFPQRLFALAQAATASMFG
jgi:NADH-quinone oxidoreductase subunit N